MSSEIQSVSFQIKRRPALKHTAISGIWDVSHAHQSLGEGDLLTRLNSV